MESLSPLLPIFKILLLFFRVPNSSNSFVAFGKEPCSLRIIRVLDAFRTLYILHTRRFLKDFFRDSCTVHQSLALIFFQRIGMFSMGPFFCIQFMLHSLAIAINQRRKSYQ